MKGMILAAGEGTRLQPLTLETPKVMLPVNGIPQIEYSIRWLKRHNVSDIGVNLFRFGEKIKDFIGDGSRFGVDIEYSEESSLLGTAGGVKQLEYFFNGVFVIVYGDVLTNFNLSKMLDHHKNKLALVTLALSEVKNTSEVGIVEMDDDQRVRGFIEKPPPGTVSGNLANGGVYIMEREVFDYIPEKSFCDFGFDIFPDLIRQGLPVYGYCIDKNEYLIDVGSMETYIMANEDVKTGKAKINYVP